MSRDDTGRNKDLVHLVSSSKCLAALKTMVHTTEADSPLQPGEFRVLGGPFDLVSLLSIP